MHLVDGAILEQEAVRAEAEALANRRRERAKGDDADPQILAGPEEAAHQIAMVLRLEVEVQNNGIDSGAETGIRNIWYTERVDVPVVLERRTQRRPEHSLWNDDRDS
jgi:hypothetical protein